MTAGFSVSKITSEVSAAPPLRVLKQEMLEAEPLLDQPFYFYKKGGQCFVFIGADGKTILKFFKQHHIRFWSWLQSLTFPLPFDDFRTKILKKHRHQTHSYLLESCKIAYEKFKDQTGLIYLQFAGQPLLQKKLLIYDPLKIAHMIDLERTDFILQKKAMPIRESFKKLIAEKQLELCKHHIDTMVELIVERCQQGIADRDFNAHSNLGILEDRVIEIDIGSYHESPSLKESSKIVLLQQTAKFKKWLEKHHVELANYLSWKIDTIGDS
jgi:hypothetical protein